jgi:hypothetical protein
MYEDVCFYNRVIEVVLTQRISFKKSGIIKRKLSKLMGTREFSPESLIERIDNDSKSLETIGIDKKLCATCKDVSEFTINRLAKNDKKELLIDDVEEMSSTITGFACWSVNVSCINYTFTSMYDSIPYNALTNRDPVIKRGFYWLTGVEPYNKVIDQVTLRYAPYAGVITRYIWEAFNYNKIKVSLPSHYKKWWNLGKGVDFSKLKKLDSQRSDYLLCVKTAPTYTNFRAEWIRKAKECGYTYTAKLYTEVKNNVYDGDLKKMKAETDFDNFHIE